MLKATRGQGVVGFAVVALATVVCLVIMEQGKGARLRKSTEESKQRTEELERNNKVLEEQIRVREEQIKEAERLSSAIQEYLLLRLQVNRVTEATRLGFKEPELVTPAELIAAQWKQDKEYDYSPDSVFSKQVIDHAISQSNNEIQRALRDSNKEKSDLLPIARETIEGNRKIWVAELGLPEHTRWSAIADVFLERERKKEAKKRNLPETAQWSDIHDYDRAKKNRKEKEKKSEP